jgi:hypothetical protein
MPSLWLEWCWRGEDDSGFEQNFAYLLPDKIADPGGGDIPCEQLDGMRPRPFSLLVGADGRTDRRRLAAGRGD